MDISNPMQIPKSRVADLIWPAIPNEAATMLMALLFQLEQSQWWSAELLTAMQLRQLDVLMKHAYESIPFYREQLQLAGFDPTVPLDMERWRRVPLLSRDVLQYRAGELVTSRDLQHHGEQFEKKTSGSTGLKMSVTDTDANDLFWSALTMRDHLWHQRDFSGRLVTIRSGRSDHDPQAVNTAESWGSPVSFIYETGPSSVFFHLKPIAQQAELLIGLQPTYLMAYPSNIVRLTHYFRTHQLTLSSLRGVVTYGELLLPEVRLDCSEVWGVPVADMYSCEEVGYIALQCPEYTHYHCQSESLLVEVLNHAGQPCAPGEIGKVVLTSLHNFAMPLIRYENRDYAEVGEPCPCGRGSTVLKRILGRERNMAIGPTGEKFWPNVTREIWSVIEGIQELQLVQESIDRLEARIVGPRSLLPSQERQLTEALCQSFGQPFSISFRYLDEIARHANGKYERFIRNF